jgi:hypothetical protein
MGYMSFALAPTPQSSIIPNTRLGETSKTTTRCPPCPLTAYTCVLALHTSDDSNGCAPIWQVVPFVNIYTHIYTNIYNCSLIMLITGDPGGGAEDDKDRRRTLARGAQGSCN